MGWMKNGGNWLLFGALLQTPAIWGGDDTAQIVAAILLVGSVICSVIEDTRQ